jgi:hypothetical protein
MDREKSNPDLCCDLPAAAHGHGPCGPQQQDAPSVLALLVPCFQEPREPFDFRSAAVPAAKPGLKQPTAPRR